MTNRASQGPRIVGSVLALLLSGVLSGHAETVTGTGFAVTFDGSIVTNHHVISECDSPIRARIEGSPEYYYIATVAARDAGRDLAVLKLQRRVWQNAQRSIRAFPRAVFRKGPAVQQGEKAITYGFPLRGLLATNGNLTLGYVSALSGLGDDRNYIQITTPVQQGNSGGPLYDGSGHVIGVVVSKLNALRVMLATGDVPQNVNFAIEIGAIRHFLQQNNVQVLEEESTNELPLPEIAQKARRSTYLIECETTSKPPQAQIKPPAQPNSIGAPAPLPLKLVAIDISKLKWSDVRQPYPSIRPEIFEMNISNAGSDRVTELTIGFLRQEKACSKNLNYYDGLKRFSVNLRPGDSVTLREQFSAGAKSFCIVKALGPPEGVAACSTPALSIDTGIAACTRAIESGDVTGDDLALAFNNRGNFYDHSGEYDRAIADYTEAIRLNPKREGPRYNRGREYVRKADYERAIVDYDEAIRLNGKFGAAFSNRGFVYFQKGNYDRAIADYTEAIRLDPKVMDTFFLRGHAHFRKHDYDRAIADYSEVIKLNPDYAPAYESRGASYHFKSDNDSAIKDYTEAIKLAPQVATTYNSRGTAYLVKGDYDRAIADYTEAIRLDPKMTSALHNRGVAKLKKGDATGTDDIAASTAITR